ncbi:hypothetical protein ACJX0J_025313, partial [Zea mays]
TIVLIFYLLICIFFTTPIENVIIKLALIIIISSKEKWLGNMTLYVVWGACLGYFKSFFGYDREKDGKWKWLAGNVSVCLLRESPYTGVYILNGFHAVKLIHMYMLVFLRFDRIQVDIVSINLSKL